jgi:UDPglucose--hexose-1-phosphate uridylyltransferase
MPVEFRKDGDQLVWVRNPFTRAVTYFTHVHLKRSGFIRRAQEAVMRQSVPDPAAAEVERRAELEQARGDCVFCPGNEQRTLEEVLRVRPCDVFPSRAADGWLIRAFYNIVPRLPDCCTGGRPESYVVVEDPRHFADDARGHEDVLYTALLPPEQFRALMVAVAEVARRAYRNPDVKAVLVRKNQGRESGASQPHVHCQVIGSDLPFATVEVEAAVQQREPHVWDEIVAFVEREHFLVERRAGWVVYFCPFGTFPRSYEIVCSDFRGRLVDLPRAQLHVLADLLQSVLRILGPLPLDYEIHDGLDVPLHVHVNARHFPYSNIGGTLNLPANLSAGTVARPVTV